MNKLKLRKNYKQMLQIGKDGKIKSRLQLLRTVQNKKRLNCKA